MATQTQIESEFSLAQNSGLMSAFTTAAWRTGIDRSLLLAIASRESNMGRTLDANYLGDGGNGIGIMQIDKRYHPEFAASVHPSDHEKVIVKGAQILKDYTQQFGGNTRYGVAAYNAGVGNVSKALVAGMDPDTYTTGKNYSRDVLQRYEMFKDLQGFGSLGVPGFDLASMQTIAGLVLISAAAGTAYLMVFNRRN